MNDLVPNQQVSRSLTVVVQKWEEKERGWGSRPDGYSVHLSEADRVQYIKDYWDGMPDRVNGMAPDEYSCPDGSPYLADVAAGQEEAFLAEITGKKGLRYYDRQYPGNGGTDGWMPVR
jgi:hypothetical protein